MHDLLKPVVPLSDDAMQAASAHIVVGRVVAVERGAVLSVGEARVAEVEVVMAVERVLKRPGQAGAIAAIAARLQAERFTGRWGRKGERVTFWGATVVEGVGAAGVADTVPRSLAAGDRVKVHLTEEDGRLVLPFWCALARLR